MEKYKCLIYKENFVVAMPVKNLLETLNPKQYEAVTAPAQSVLILAGAGSGKTRVLTTRIAWLLEQNMARPANILAVTFTNKAAKEMMTRLESMIPYDLSHMWVGTFHGLCNRILRRHAEEAGLPKSFQILDSSDQLSMVKRIMKQANVDPEQLEPKKVQNFINWNKENGIRANRASTGSVNDQGVELYRLYEETCQKEGAVDFAELLLRCFELLDRNEVIRAHYQDRFQHILVDEFQDTNVLQYHWLKLLAGASRNGPGPSKNAVFAVGDDDQSIYAFRGANVGNMSDFLTDFLVKEPIRLEENYRSTGAILEAANVVISHNASRLGKNLWTSGAKGDNIAVVKHDTDNEEAEWVADEIRADVRRGNAYRDHAILYRMNAQSRAIESAFTARGIPYRIYGGLRFFERQEVKHVLAYLRLLDGAGDDTSFLRVVNMPTRGIGAKTIEKLVDDASHTGMSLWATLTHPSYTPAPKLAAFRDLIYKIRTEAEVKNYNLSDTISLVIQRSGLEDFYSNEKDGEERLANMTEMVPAALGYLKNEGIPPDTQAFEITEQTDQTPLQGFLTQATLEAGERNEGDDQDSVQVMTVHAAKGLEFKHVYIIGAEEGIFPHFSSFNETEKGGVDEERRLMYVAITRAQKTLAISHCNTRFIHGEEKYNPPSSFLDEIPEALIRRIDHSSKRSSSGGYSSGGYDREYGWERPSMNGSRSSGRSSGGYGGYSGYNNGSRYGRGEGSRGDKDDWRRGLSSSGQTYRPSEDPVVARAHAKKANDTYGYQVGGTITHAKFGSGVVKKLSGTGDDARIVVDFKTAGTKELLLKLAAKNLSEG